MKLACILFLSIAFNSVAFSQIANEEKRVTELSAKKFQWMINHNFDSLSNMLHDNVAYIHSNGWSQSKKEILDDFRSGKIALKNIDVQMSNVRIFNQTAIVNGQGKFTGEMNGTSFSLELVYTEGYIKEKESWLLVSRLATRVIK
jgi:hypothetical protein